MCYRCQNQSFSVKDQNLFVVYPHEHIFVIEKCHTNFARVDGGSKILRGMQMQLWWDDSPVPILSCAANIFDPDEIPVLLNRT